MCWDSESLSEWLADGVSDPWLAGEDDLDGDSKNFLIEGWLKTIESHVLVPCNKRAQEDLLIFPEQKKLGLSMPEKEEQNISAQK